MLNGRYKGQTIGSGTHVWKFDEDMKTGKMTQEDCEFAESCMSRSIGHCMTMGTANNGLYGGIAGINIKQRSCYSCCWLKKESNGTVERQKNRGDGKENLTIDKILTREAFENSIIVKCCGGRFFKFYYSLAGHCRKNRVQLELEDFDRLGSKIPLLLNLMPSGKYLMEDFIMPAACRLY